MNIFVGYLTSNVTLSISDCPRARTAHPPRYHYRGDNQQRERAILSDNFGFCSVLRDYKLMLS